MPKRNNIGFHKPPEPAFITRMKQEIGMKTEPTVDTKREELAAATNEDFEDREDDLPTVVVLRKGDLTEEEAKDEVEKQKKAEDEIPAGQGGRIMFKRPVKRDIEASVSKEAGPAEESKKSKKEEDSKKDEVKKEKSEKKDKSSKKSDKKMLSFNDDEEEDF